MTTDAKRERPIRIGDRVCVDRGGGWSVGYVENFDPGRGYGEVRLELIAHTALATLARAGEIRRVGKGTYQQIEAAHVAEGNAK